MSPLDVRAATDNRDSLAKMVYSRMFDWLVQKVNAAIGQDPDALALVGVLDIYGDLCLPLSSRIKRPSSVVGAGSMLKMPATCRL